MNLKYSKTQIKVADREGGGGMCSTSSGICSPSDITWFSKLNRIKHIRAVFKSHYKGEKIGHLVKVLSQRKQLFKKMFFYKIVLSKWSIKKKSESGKGGVSLTIDRQHGSTPPTRCGYSVGDIVLVHHSHPPSRGVHIHGWSGVGLGLLWNIRL